ncbi:MAG: PAAR-like domain-containing protein [Polyangiales bacterium]
MNQPAVHKSTMIRAIGDEAGVAGWRLVSGMNMGPAAFKMGVMMVKIEGNDAINQLKQVGQNWLQRQRHGRVAVPKVRPRSSSTAETEARALRRRRPYG